MTAGAENEHAAFTERNDNMELEGSPKSAQIMEYCVELMSRLTIQRQHEDFCDVTIMVEGREFKAHRSVLSAACPYFDSMFTCNMKEKGQDKVCLEEIGVSVMECVLDFMYTGDVHLNEGNAHVLMATANYLLLPSLKSRAVAFLQENLDVSNCIKTYYLALKYECQVLLCSAREFINSNFVSVCETGDFLALTHDQVKEWISSDDIIIGAERDVFEVVLKWIRNDDTGDREKNFLELFQSIRLTCVSRDYFFTDIIASRLVRENPECLCVALDATKDMAYVSGEYFPKQKPRKCLEKHQDAIVICYRLHTLCYLPSHNSWYHLAPMMSIGMHHMVTSCRGCLYSPVERFDPLVNSWSVIAKPPQHVSFMSAVALSGYLYLIGGKNHTSTQRFDSTYRYDPDSNSWQKVASLSSPRSSVCAVSDDKFIYAIGGNDDNGFINMVERFDPQANTWTPLSPMTEKRAGACGVHLKENIFVFGGKMTTTLRSCEKYCCTTDQWQVISSMHEPRRYASALVFGDRMYVFGGSSQTFESYDPDNDEWEHKGSMPIELVGLTCSANALRLSKTLLELLRPAPVGS